MPPNQGTKRPTQGQHREANTYPPEDRRSPPQAGNIFEQLMQPNGLNIMGIDKSDLTLAAMLFLLYLESHDEDFLIILAIIGFSIFKSGAEEKEKEK